MRLIKQLLCLIGICGIFLCGCAQEEEMIALGTLEESPTIEELEISDTSSVQVVYVHICGSIKYPGVYALDGDSRVVDVVNAAGGLLDDAAVAEVNLAKSIEDGMQIIIPSQSEVIDSGTEQEADGKININTASQSQLCTLPNIGESRALDIIAYREANGGFLKIEDIMNVTGIKDGIYEDIKDFIYVP